MIAPFIRRAAEEAAKAAAEAAAIEAAASKERAVAGAAAAAAGAAAAAAKAKEMQAALAAGAVSQQEAAVVMHEAAVVAMEAKTAAVEQQIVAAAAIQLAINSGPSEVETRATKVRGDLVTKLTTKLGFVHHAHFPPPLKPSRTLPPPLERQVLGDLATKLASGATDDASLLRAVKAAGGIERVVSLAKGNLDSLAVQVMTSLP